MLFKGPQYFIPGITTTCGVLKSLTRSALGIAVFESPLRAGFKAYSFL